MRMIEDDASLRIVRSIINLGGDLGLTIVAEGVETEAQRDMLREFGCDYAQGYLYAHPLLAADATALRTQPRPPPRLSTGGRWC
jgi:EAL domain-containing protein (putative c-di-GMP-specific phosphodiesterase class I)